MWLEAGVDISNEVVKTVHRTGPSYTDKNSNVEYKRVTAYFTTFWHRAMFIEQNRKWNQG